MNSYRLSLLTQQNVLLAIGLGVAGLTALGYTLSPSRARRTQTRSIPSPLVTLLPKLSNDQVARLPYPPDFFPGARDVDTPFGSMRVYEWGPETGRKVLMIPGDTTPAPAFGLIAPAMVERGFRVMVFDCWGRGYSDTPLSAPHDANLFTLQIVYALLSSTLSWTGTSETFSMIGFSLGGAIAMSFASHFPALIDSIVLLAPAGFIRTMPEGYSSVCYRRWQWVPTSYLRRLTARVIGVNPHGQGTPPAAQPELEKRVDPKDPDLPALWQWQFDHHEGFVTSFADTIQNGPAQNQHEEWRRVCNIICGIEEDFVAKSCKLRGQNILLVCGESDTVVKTDETVEDLAKLLPDHLILKTVPGDHGFPISSGQETVRWICEFWGIEY